MGRSIAPGVGNDPSTPAPGPGPADGPVGLQASRSCERVHLLVRSLSSPGHLEFGPGCHHGRREVRVVTGRRRPEGLLRVIDGLPGSPRPAEDGAGRRSGAPAQRRLGRQADGVHPSVGRRDDGFARTWDAAPGPRPLPGATRGGAKDGSSSRSRPVPGRGRRRRTGPTSETVVMLRPPAGPSPRRRLAAVGIGLTFLGAGVAILAAATSREMDQLLGVYAGGWLAVIGGLTVFRRSQATRRPRHGSPGPTRPAARPAGGGAA